MKNKSYGCLLLKSLHSSRTRLIAPAAAFLVCDHPGDRTVLFCAQLGSPALFYGCFEVSARLTLSRAAIRSFLSFKSSTTDKGSRLLSNTTPFFLDSAWYLALSLLRM